jgi:hypothetical protein
MTQKEFAKQIESCSMQGDPMFYEYLVKMAQLHAKKNHDYSQDQDPLSNLKACEAIGIPAYKGVLVRLQDKWSRLIELSKKEAKVLEESVEDTLLDMAIYAILAIVLRTRQKQAIDKK